MDAIGIVALVFLGYFLGRVGDHLGGHMNIPHHWIYGVLMILFGFSFYEYTLGANSAYSGIGLFISDYEDFMHFRIYGPDDHKKELRFWHFD